MAGNLNKVMLIGRLGRDPEVRYTQSGTAVANLRLATTEQWTDKSGQRQERTEWHTAVLWGRQAEIAGEYLSKGRLIFVEGRIETRKWQDQQGQDRYSTEIRALNFQMLDGRGDSGGGRGDSGGGRGDSGGGRGDSGGGGGDSDGGGGYRGGDGGQRGGGPARRGPSADAPPDDDQAPPPEDDDIPF